MKRAAHISGTVPYGRGSNDERGFSLIEVLVSLAIMVVIATVVTPNMAAVLDKARVDRAVESLESFSGAVDKFHSDVGDYPSDLGQLANAITTTDADLCGASYPPGHEKKWNGPYVTRLMPATGVPVAIGNVQLPLTRVDEGTGQRALMRFTLPRVTEEDAIAVNRRIDGDADANANSVRWTVPDGEGLVTLYFLKPVKGC